MRRRLRLLAGVVCFRMLVVAVSGSGEGVMVMVGSDGEWLEVVVVGRILGVGGWVVVIARMVVGMEVVVEAGIHYRRLMVGEGESGEGCVVGEAMSACEVVVVGVGVMSSGMEAVRIRLVVGVIDDEGVVVVGAMIGGGE